MNMKIAVIFGLAAALLLTLNRPVCAENSESSMQEQHKTSYDDVKEKIGAAAESISQYTADQRDQAVVKAKEELSEFDRNVDEMERKIDRHWDRLSADTKQKWQDTRKKLQQKRLEAAEWYGGVKRGSADAWDEIKKGYSRAYSELAQGWERASKEFSGETGSEDAGRKKE